jgi:transposase
MYRVRTTKTGSGKTAVQIVHRGDHRIKVVKHIGTADDADEVKRLVEKAQAYIIQTSKTTPLFPEIFHDKKSHTVDVDDLEFTNTYHSFAYDFLSYFYDRCGFGKLNNNLLRNLAIIRIIEPCSKLQAVYLLKEYFGKQYGKTVMYEKLPAIKDLKADIEKYAVNYAKKHFSFDFSLVFYDVTTLYFESFKEDGDKKDDKGKVISIGLRKPGFSKDNKSNQPQIVIGLIVTKEGFPVSVDIFEGNTFEGKTFIPTITKFKNTYSVKKLIVVADAAMISFENVEKLKDNKLSYIVGARVANLKQSQMEEISKAVGSIDGKTIRVITERGLLICEYSAKRYEKDKREMDKQIARAEKMVEKNIEGKRAKFLALKKKRKKNEVIYEVNEALVKKTKLLLGIKGYYTNLTNEEDKTIIEHYHSLWHVEKAFRIAKSDLEARPIFHHKKEIIEVHIFIVFVSLCMVKAIELLTNYSIKKVKDMIWRIMDIEFIDTFTKREFRKRMVTRGNEMAKLLSTLQPKKSRAY